MPDTEDRAVLVVGFAVRTESRRGGNDPLPERQKQTPEHKHHGSGEKSNDRAIAKLHGIRSVGDENIKDRLPSADWSGDNRGEYPRSRIPPKIKLPREPLFAGHSRDRS